uniref:RING-type domain-containing protein n=1 Tax=Graphocephala atropunctata TaxID=36148 RepID=A0A1B6LX46_9HEMI
MEKVTNILNHFPLLIPSSDFKLWSGIISVKEEEIPVTISTPCFPSLDNFSIMCPVDMELNIQQSCSSYKFVVGSEQDGLLQFLEYLQSKKTLLEPEGSATKLDYCLYNHILKELQRMGSEHVVTCRGDLRHVMLRTIDERGVEHRLGVGIPRDYPNGRPIVEDVNMPEVALQDLGQAESITEMFNIFQSLVDSFQEFWEAYESLKSNTWLIDPEHPQLKDTHCRIIIGENVSMLVTLNPQDVNTCPDIKFLGPENATIQFINSMEKKLKTVGWNEDMSVLENLVSLLGLQQFPQPDGESAAAAEQGECSICFTLRLDDQALPSKVCNNTKCNSYFHITCLAQWFQAVPTNETSFNLISGDCPCCGERILCPMKMS